MQKLARATIAIWQGGSLWLLDTPPHGPGPAPSTDFHAHHAIQVVLSLGGDFQLWLGDETLAGPNLAVAPDVLHRFEAQGLYAILFVEPESADGRALTRALFRDAGLCELPQGLAGGIAESLKALSRSPPPRSADLAAIGRSLIVQLVGDTRHEPVDRRIQDVVGWVAEHPEDPIALADAATIAKLSPSRFSHLFVEQTGLSFKTYLLWIRLTRALRLMTDGANLTEAAHAAGFSDSAHFSRTFRRMFGVAPTNLKLV